MASLTVKHKKIRANKSRKAGSARKKAQERDGTTPKFPIHPAGKSAKKA